MTGTAVFLTSDPLSAPTALMHSLKHYKVLHEKNVILSIEIDHRPRVPQGERVRGTIATLIERGRSRRRGEMVKR